MRNLNPAYFVGSLAFDTKLTDEQREYLFAFARTRRMKRDPEKAKLLADPLREALFMDIGEDGGYYVGPEENDDSILKRSIPPDSQPGLRCKWEPSYSGQSLVWADNKFYGYREWLEYIISHFIETWGREINGFVEMRNEDDKSLGFIKVIKNKIHIDYKYSSSDKLKAVILNDNSPDSAMPKPKL